MNGINIIYGGIEYNAKSPERVKEILKHTQRAEKVKKGKVVPIEITNGTRVLEMFVGADKVGGWEKNGGTHETPDYIRGVSGIVDFFKLNLAS
jgi:hypothetical protein